MDTLGSFDQDELTALARIDIQKERVEQGLEKLKRILAGESPSLEAVSMAARLYAQLGLFDHAKPLFEQYLAARPDAVEEEFQLGMVELEKGESELALKIWEDMLRRQPTFPPGLFYSALVLSRQSKIAEARRNLDVLLQTVATDNLYFERGKELLQTLEREAMQQPSAASQAYQA